MSNSSLVDYVKISPNKNNRINSQYNPSGEITKITIHHMAGNLSVENCGNGFFQEKRQASANYGIGTDGRIGMYVEEKDRAWTSSSPSNDYKAVTIEVANDGGAETNWHVSDKALSKLIELCVDICKRNNIKNLNYTGNSSGNLTRHNMFAATTCPGQYLQSKFPYIASEVNKRLNGETEIPSESISNTNETSNKINVFYKVKCDGKWLPEVKNLEDYAGIVGKEITDVAIKTDKGNVEYRVHIKGGKWLPIVTGYDTKDIINGYAGNGKVIDAIEIYYNTPKDIRPYKKAKYRVSSLKNNYYSWQYDNETSNGQDGYAGMFGKSIDRLQISIE